MRTKLVIFFAGFCVLAFALNMGILGVTAVIPNETDTSSVGPDLTALKSHFNDWPYVHTSSGSRSNEAWNKIALVAKGITAPILHEWLTRGFKSGYENYLEDPEGHTADASSTGAYNFWEDSGAVVDYMKIDGGLLQQYKAYKMRTYYNGVDHFYRLRIWPTVTANGVDHVIVTIHWDEVDVLGDHLSVYLENGEDQLVVFFAPYLQSWYKGYKLTQVLYNRPVDHFFWSNAYQATYTKAPWPAAFKPASTYTSYSSLKLAGVGYGDGDTNTAPYPSQWLGFGKHDSDGNAVYMSFVHYNVDITGRYIYAHNNHDDGGSGEFRIESRLLRDGVYSTVVKTPNYALASRQSVSLSYPLTVKGATVVDNDDYVYVQLIEDDAWPNADDTIIGWVGTENLAAKYGFSSYSISWTVYGSCGCYIRVDVTWVLS
jgi:hypothetical protein